MSALAVRSRFYWRLIASVMQTPAVHAQLALTELLRRRPQAHSFVVAAPVRLAAPVRRHQSLMFACASTTQKSA